ncbi:unnamed protein product [Diabrotica balteata]|uniref:Cytochrome P450 n=1 Tax=Diabrotica balteata TaxID=107213 RepID=A0A9N9TB02_DIABA|nr:unnamed protein product [Diabrotica balteata]
MSSFPCWLTTILLIISIIYLVVYKYLTRNFGYWKNKNVKFVKPIPFFGNFYNVLTFKTTTQEHIKNIWDQIDAPYFGLFILDEPVLVLKSPKLIKDVLLKDASIFCNRRVATPSHRNMKHGLFFLKDQNWRKMRTTFTPLFTSGMIKQLQPHLTEINKVMIKYLNENCGVIEVSKVGGNFATEFLARCFYEANPHCFDNEGSGFSKYINKMFDFNLRNGIIQNLYFIKPSWVAALKLNLIGDSAISFFEGVFKDSMATRQYYDGKPQNLVDVANRAVLEAKNSKEDTLEFEMIMSNALLFLIAGRDTTSTIINFTLYELAMNQEVQNTLRNQIQINFKKYGEFSYEAVQENKYLEMCIQETMRKYPALPFMDRTPINDYTFEGTDLTIPRNMSVLIPLFALHRDEKVYSNAETYDPERFLDKQINSDGLSFIPFGDGPKNCIAKRLGMVVLSMALSNIILNFKFERCSNTPEKIEFEPKSFVLASKVGLPLKIIKI